MFVFTIGDIIGVIFWGTLITLALVGWAAETVRGYLRSKRK